VSGPTAKIYNSFQGGDEFVILLSEIKQTGDAGLKAAQILTAIKAPFEIDSHKLDQFLLRFFSPDA